MSCRTERGVTSVRGRNPQTLVGDICRQRVYDSLYWKEQCFGLNAETLLDKAVALRVVGVLGEGGGGGGGGGSATPFLALLVKLLQIGPEEEIIDIYLGASEFKYLQALACTYVRLTYPSVQVYAKLEPFLADYRNLRLASGREIKPFDVFVDELLCHKTLSVVELPFLVPRAQLEKTKRLKGPRQSSERERFQGLLESGKVEDMKVPEKPLWS